MLSTKLQRFVKILVVLQRSEIIMQINIWQTSARLSFLTGEWSL